MSSLILALIFTFWFVSLLLERVVRWIFLSRLRSLHLAIWQQLGEPMTMVGTLRFYRFLWRRDYDLLADEKIAVIGRATRFFFVCEIVLLASVAVVTLLCTYNH